MSQFLGPEGVYCCLTGTTCTLFTTVSTVNTLVTVLICCCVSELLCPHHNVWSCYVPIVMYGLRLFIQELHCFPNYLHASVSITSPSVIALLLLVSEIPKCIA